MATDDQVMRDQLAAAGFRADIEVPPPPTLDDGEDSEEGQPSADYSVVLCQRCQQSMAPVNTGICSDCVGFPQGQGVGHVRVGAIEGDERPLFDATYRADASQAVEDLLKVVTARGAQYGSPEDDKANLRGALAFGVDPIVGASIRANDKWIRLRNLLRERDAEGRIVVRDRAHYAQIRDQYLDIAGYSIKCMEMLDELAEQEGWL